MAPAPRAWSRRSLRRRTRPMSCSSSGRADGGRKILISGGGRCNVLPSVLAPERFVTDSPAHLHARHAAVVAARTSSARSSSTISASRSRSRRKPASCFRSRIARATFATGWSRSRAARGVAVAVRHQRHRRSLRGAAGWTLPTSAGPIAAGRVVLATGGLSVPATGQRRHRPCRRRRRSATAWSPPIRR